MMRKKFLWVEHILLKESKKLLGNGDGSLIFGRSQKKSSMEKHHSQHGVIMMIQTSIPGLLIVSHCHDQYGMMVASSNMCKICPV